MVVSKNVPVNQSIFEVDDKEDIRTASVLFGVCFLKLQAFSINGIESFYDGACDGVWF